MFMLGTRYPPGTSMFYHLILSLVFTIVPGSSSVRPDHALFGRQTSASSLQTDFQVYEPVLTPSGDSNQYGCIYTQTLMVHDFAFSYGMPFIGSYTPPPCSFNRVNINFTVTSRGRQFDRLAIMYLGDIEVFRTSTAEPTKQGIIWTYIKEMQEYNALWGTEQKIIFDLGNLVNDIYTGVFHTTLTATFFTVPDTPPAADLILPISARRGAEDSTSAFSIPDQNASVAYKLPANANRAVVSLAACGQIGEEFWFSNVYSSEVLTFNSTNGELLGGGPWREVQLLIDGQLAGVSWPFPVIFTGGVAPGLWRPIVGIEAFDLKEHEIDITPWLPYLLDGASHTFEIRVASLADDGKGHATVIDKPGSYWIVSGKIFLFLSSDSKARLTGTKPTISTPPPVITISSAVTKNGTGANETLSYNTTVSRQISVAANVSPASGGPANREIWTQTISFTNINTLTAQGLVQNTIQTTRGADYSGSSGHQVTYTYPLEVTNSYAEFPDGSFALNGSVSHGLHFNKAGASIFPSGVQSFLHLSSSSGGGNEFFPVTVAIPGAAPGSPLQQLPLSLSSLPALDFERSFLTTTQSGSAQYFASATDPSASYSFGSTQQTFTFNGFSSAAGTIPDIEIYTRNVKAVNGTVVEDEEKLIGRSGSFGVPTGPAGSAVEMPGLATVRSVRRLIGRGPGSLNEGQR